MSTLNIIGEAYLEKLALSGDHRRSPEMIQETRRWNNTRQQAPQPQAAAAPKPPSNFGSALSQAYGSPGNIATSIGNQILPWRWGGPGQPLR